MRTPVDGLGLPPEMDDLVVSQPRLPIGYLEARNHDSTGRRNRRRRARHLRHNALRDVLRSYRPAHLEDHDGDQADDVDDGSNRADATGDRHSDSAAARRKPRLTALRYLAEDLFLAALFYVVFYSDRWVVLRLGRIRGRVSTAAQSEPEAAPASAGRSAFLPADAPPAPEAPEGISPAELTFIDGFPPLRIGPYFEHPDYHGLRS